MRRTGRPRTIHGRKSPVIRSLDRKSPVSKTPVSKSQPNVWVNVRKNLGLSQAIPKVETDCSLVETDCSLANPKPVCFSSDILRATDEIIVPIPVYSMSPMVTPDSTPPRKVFHSEEDPCPLSSASCRLDNQEKISSSSSFPVVRRLHFESESVNLGCSSGSRDFSSKSLLAEDSNDESVKKAIQMKSDIMIRILNKTWSIQDENLRVNEILRLLIDNQKMYTTRMQSEYEIMSKINYITAQKLFTMYSKLLSYIMAEISLFEKS